MSDRWISASEVGQYTFCARAWWLSHVEGVIPDDQRAVRRGRRAHRRHGRRVWSSRALQIVGWLLLLLASLALLLGLTFR